MRRGDGVFAAMLLFGGLPDFYYTRRHPNRCGVIGHIINDCCASADNCVGANRNAGNDACTRSDEAAFAYAYATRKMNTRTYMGRSFHTTFVIDDRTRVDDDRIRQPRFGADGDLRGNHDIFADSCGG